MNALFVTGTDTGVGKTLVCTALIAARADARYHKPVQTGADDDTNTVVTGAGVPAARARPPFARFALPASPHYAAAVEERRVPTAALIEALARLAAEPGPWIVEGAGGLLVPYDDDTLTADVIAAAGLPVLVVASTRLGTINHTLLTLREIERRGLTTPGVVLSGPGDPSCDTALAAHAGVPVLHRIPHISAPTPAALARHGAAIWAALAARGFGS